MIVVRSLLLLLFAVIMLSRSVAGSCTPIPSNMKLLSVIVIHRHGDRSQIEKALSPAYPESQTISDIWKSKMPSIDSMKIMASIGMIDEGLVDIRANTSLKSHDPFHFHLYSGWDSKHFPYGQLTQRGFEQLYNVGNILRQRYIGSFLPANVLAAKDLIYGRSTNMCRTIQSLHALLAGMFSINEKSLGDENYSKDKISIHRRPSNQETMVLIKLHTSSSRPPHFILTITLFSVLVLFR